MSNQIMRLLLFLQAIQLNFYQLYSLSIGSIDNTVTNSISSNGIGNNQSDQKNEKPLLLEPKFLDILSNIIEHNASNCDFPPKFFLKPPESDNYSKIVYDEINNFCSPNDFKIYAINETEETEEPMKFSKLCSILVQTTEIMCEDEERKSVYKNFAVDAFPKNSKETYEYWLKENITEFCTYFYANNLFFQKYQNRDFDEDFPNFFLLPEPTEDEKEKNAKCVNFCKKTSPRNDGIEYNYLCGLIKLNMDVFFRMIQQDIQEHPVPTLPLSYINQKKGSTKAMTMHNKKTNANESNKNFQKNVSQNHHASTKRSIPNNKTSEEALAVTKGMDVNSLIESNNASVGIQNQKTNLNGTINNNNLTLQKESPSLASINLTNSSTTNSSKTPLSLSPSSLLSPLQNQNQSSNEKLSVDTNFDNNINKVSRVSTFSSKVSEIESKPETSQVVNNNVPIPTSNASSKEVINSANYASKKANMLEKNKVSAENSLLLKSTIDPSNSNSKVNLNSNTGNSINYNYGDGVSNKLYENNISSDGGGGGGLDGGSLEQNSGNNYYANSEENISDAYKTIVTDSLKVQNDKDGKNKKEKSIKKFNKQEPSDSEKKEQKPSVRAEEKKETVISNNPRFQSSEGRVSHVQINEDSSSFNYFITFIGIAAICYIAFRNKKKIVAYVLEGNNPRAARSRSRRPSSSGSYRKLENNFE